LVIPGLGVPGKYAEEAKSAAFENISLDESAPNMVKYL
jgi:hypothetical protein